MPPKGDNKPRFPAARIKKLMQVDEDVQRGARAPHVHEDTTHTMSLSRTPIPPRSIIAVEPRRAARPHAGHATGAPFATDAVSGLEYSL